MNTDAKVSSWLERELGGTVVKIQRQERWRTVRFADVSCGTSIVGARVSSF